MPAFSPSRTSRILHRMPDDLRPPLDGVLVINAGQILAAPFCATLLAEFGADVIKLERPGTGEPNHGSLSYVQDNRSQRGVTCNLHDPRGQELFRSLCAHADVLIENFRPGTPDGPPVRPGYMIADYSTGVFAAFGALTALRARELNGGLGQDVDIGLYESIWKQSGTIAAGYQRSGEIRERSGNYFPGVAPGEQFATADGHFLIISGATQGTFERLCEAMGQPQITSDPRFAERSERRRNVEALHALIGEWVQARTLEEALALLARHGVPAAKVYAASDIAADPHYAAREQIIEVPSEQHGLLAQPGIVPKLSRTPGRVRRRAPTLGEHNREVYGSLLGLSAETLAELEAEGVI